MVVEREGDVPRRRAQGDPIRGLERHEGRSRPEKRRSIGRLAAHVERHHAPLELIDGVKVALLVGRQVACRDLRGRDGAIRIEERLRKQRRLLHRATRIGRIDDVDDRCLHIRDVEAMLIRPDVVHLGKPGGSRIEVVRAGRILKPQRLAFRDVEIRRRSLQDGP